jgi:hypothetical protein
VLPVWHQQHHRQHPQYLNPTFHWQIKRKKETKTVNIERRKKCVAREDRVLWSRTNQAYL